MQGDEQGSFPTRPPATEFSFFSAPREGLLDDEPLPRLGFFFFFPLRSRL